MSERVWSETDLARRAKRRLAVLQHAEEGSKNVSATCRALPANKTSWSVGPLTPLGRTHLVPALLTAGAAHFPVIHPHLQEAPYLGISFIVLSETLVVLASALVSWDAPVVYAAAAVTAGAAVIGYTATRLVAFPMLADDVGNWLEPLGVVAVAAEVVAVCASVVALHAHLRSLNTATRSGIAVSDPEALPIAELAPAH